MYTFSLFFRSPVLLYSGGMPRASYGDRHCLTIQQDKQHITLDFTSRVIDFFTVQSIEPERGLTRITRLDLWVCNVSSIFLIPPPLLRVWRPIGFSRVARRGAGCDWSADARMALSADSLPRPSSLLSHHLLLPHRQRPSQTMGEVNKRWESTTRPPAHTHGEKSVKEMILFC